MQERGAPRSDVMPADLVVVGRIVGAYGIKGWVKLSPESTPSNTVLMRSRRWWLRAGSSAPRAAKVSQVRPQGNFVVAELEGVSQREQADAMRSQSVLVSRSDFPPPEQGQYYWVDLIGCRVENAQSVLLGQVTDLVDHGAHSILVVQPPPNAPMPGDGAAQLLIPFVEQYLQAVDLPNRLIRVEWDFDY